MPPQITPKNINNRCNTPDQIHRKQSNFSVSSSILATRTTHNTTRRCLGWKKTYSLFLKLRVHSIYDRCVLIWFVPQTASSIVSPSQNILREKGSLSGWTAQSGRRPRKGLTKTKTWLSQSWSATHAASKHAADWHLSHTSAKSGDLSQIDSS